MQIERTFEDFQSVIYHAPWATAAEMNGADDWIVV